MARSRTGVLVAMVAVATIVQAGWLAPATLADARLAQFSNGAVRLLDAEGTIWRGRGTVAAAASRVPIAWGLDFWPLLQRVARVRLFPRDGASAPRGTIAIGPAGVAFSDVDLAIPAPMLIALAGQATSASIAGEVRATADTFELASGSSRGNATLLWRAARVAGLPGMAPLDLGDVRTQVTANGDGVGGPVTNDGGDMALRGDWSIHTRDGIAVTLRIKPRRADQAELVRALAAIATPDGSDYRIEWRVPPR